MVVKNKAIIPLYHTCYKKSIVYGGKWGFWVVFVSFWEIPVIMGKTVECNYGLNSPMRK